MHQSLFSHPFLLSVWADDYQAWGKNGDDDALRIRLQNWADKHAQKETSAQSPFEQIFFAELWGYTGAGTQAKEHGYTMHAQYPVDKAGQSGGVGQADLAMGWFNHPELPRVPQVLCEFKDINSALDAPQKRKGNDRSPVKQCADYLKHARDQHDPYGTQKILPNWGMVTDMQEFRLYWRSRMPLQYERFVIRDILANSEAARRQRFLFAKLFHRDQLLDRGNGSPLARLLTEQRIQEKKLEKTFYFEYRDYRVSLYQRLLAANPDYQSDPRALVRLTQKLLDRFIFVLFCEDMGAHLDYPVNLLRELLVEASASPSYDPGASDLWNSKIKRLFESMRDGKPFSNKPINRFNGGLFAADAALDPLVVPDSIFCAAGQSHALLAYPLTLLYFSAAYNFGLDESGDRTIGLYTLGRIFEQSITDLEIMEAEAAHVPSLMKLSKRKTDGVYYTPEWVTAAIVEETLGLRIQELRAALPLAPDDQQVDADHTKSTRTFNRNKNTLSKQYFTELGNYETRLSAIKVLDPACGSGAFLIQALRCLTAEHEWLAAERARVSYQFKQGGLFDRARAYREVLANNLYGVDVNAESVDITKLALWLHTALPGKPLSALDSHIVCGNSLVAPDIETTLGVLSLEQKQRINPFDYRVAFPDVFQAGGFDVLVGNPPYIKLQNMRQVQPEATDYWVQAKTNDGAPLFASAQTGNYDIYLLFIEQGLRLLRPEGRMGYIAPSVWAVNEYGAGLRRHLAENKRLERWVDFNDFQIFDEAITYTALQFFTGVPNDTIKVVFAPNGDDDLTALDWSTIEARPYTTLPASAPWEFMPESEREFITKLRKNHKTLAQSCDRIMVGIQTSADSIYHLSRVAPGQYRCHAGKGNTVIVQIEDALMKPLVSGPEAKRYRTPQTDTYLLFPYDLSGTRPALYSSQKIADKFPKGWAYLKYHEASLRARENGKFDVEGWYQFGRNQNIDKQEYAKLIVAQTVPAMRVCFDSEAAFYLNNVRVNGILPKADNGWFLLGVLNAPVADYVFRRIAKPKDGGFYEANKQFIAPLPIPNADATQQNQIAEQAKALQKLHTAYRDTLAKLSGALLADQLSDDATRQSPTWLFGDAVDAEKIRLRAAKEAADLKGATLTRWVNMQCETALAEKLQIFSRLHPRSKLEVVNDTGEITLWMDGIKVLAAFVAADESPFIAAQWRQAVRTTPLTPSITARSVLNALLRIKTTDNPALRNRIVELDNALMALSIQIDSAEAQINSYIYKLYCLSQSEIEMIERD